MRATMTKVRRRTIDRTALDGSESSVSWFAQLGPIRRVVITVAAIAITVMMAAIALVVASIAR